MTCPPGATVTFGCTCALATFRTANTAAIRVIAFPLNPKKHPTSNIEHPTAKELEITLIGCSMLSVGCWMFFTGDLVSKTSPNAVSFLRRRFGRLGFGLGRRFRFRWFAFSRLVLGRFRGGGILFCGFLVFFAAVISNVKAAALENQ